MSERDLSLLMPGEVQAEFDRLTARAERAEAAIQRVRAVHERIADAVAPRLGLTAPDMCSADWATWPCPTIAALDSTDPPEPRTSVPLKDLIEKESAQSPEFAAAVERTNAALDADCGHADALGELDAYRDGMGQLAIDPPGRNSPRIEQRGSDGFMAVYLQQTHLGVPVWICGGCVRMSVAAAAPNPCPGCGGEDMVGAALSRGEYEDDDAVDESFPAADSTDPQPPLEPATEVPTLTGAQLDAAAEVHGRDCLVWGDEDMTMPCTCGLESDQPDAQRPEERSNEEEHGSSSGAPKGDNQ